MKLLKKTNHPPYTFDNADNVVFRDTNGIPLICSHEFDHLKIRNVSEKVEEARYKFRKCSTRWLVTLKIPVLSHK